MIVRFRIELTAQPVGVTVLLKKMPELVKVCPLTGQV
jgi:hypothetical protein